MRTKLQPPRPRTDLLVRERLIDRIRTQLTGTRLILVSAPAGTGKTTLLATAAAALGCPYAWMTLDIDDNDLARFLAVLLASLVSGAAAAAEVNLAIELPKLDVAEYHRPYVAVWVERADQSVATNLGVWYEGNPQKRGENTKFLAELRTWWRRSGRNQTFPIDGVTGPTRAAGVHQLKFVSTQPQLASLAAGKYQIVIEAARENGGREVVRIPFNWPAKDSQSAQVKGERELGTVALNLTP